METAYLQQVAIPQSPLLLSTTSILQSNGNSAKKKLGKTKAVCHHQRDAMISTRGDLGQNCGKPYS